MPAQYRWLICFLVALFLLFYAVPQLPVKGSPLEAGYSLLWLFFCLLVIGSNLYALLGGTTGRAAPQVRREIRQVQKGERMRGTGVR